MFHLGRTAAPLRNLFAAEYHDTMQVADANRLRRELVGGEGGEPTWLIERLGVALNLVPEMLRALVAFVRRTHVAGAADVRRTHPDPDRSAWNRGSAATGAAADVTL